MEDCGLSGGRREEVETGQYHLRERVGPSHKLQHIISEFVLSDHYRSI